MRFSISSSSEDNVASAILFTHSPTPTSFPGLFPSRGGRPPREGKSPGNENLVRILTKRILTCLFKKRGLFSILVQNSLKVTKKVLVFRKVARSCSLTKKLLKILKVAKKLPSRIWKGLGLSRYVKGVPFVNRRCTKRVPFRSKFVYKRVRGWISGLSLLP